MLNIFQKKTMKDLPHQPPVSKSPSKPTLTRTEDFNNQTNKLFEGYLNDGFEREAVYAYKNLNGCVIYYRLRFVDKNGKKIIRPVKMQGQRYVIGEPEFTGTKPLYGQEKLSQSEGLAYVVEGENKVVAFRNLGITALTSGGATSAKSADWSPLKDRPVIIWPDFDKPGADYANEVAEILLGFNCNVRVVDVAKLNLNESDDVVDWLKQNPAATKEEILSLATYQYPTKNPATQATLPDQKTEVLETLALAHDIQDKYPEEALPTTIHEAVKEVVDFIQCPLPLAASSALAHIALVSQALVDVERTSGLDGPSSLFFLTIAESGERKTSVDNKFSAAIRAWEKKNKSLYDKELNKFSAQIEVWEAKEQSILNAIKVNSKKGIDPMADEQALASHRNDKPCSPALKSMIYTDATAEALAWELHSKFRYGGVFSSEGGAIFGGAGMQKESAMKYLSLLNIVWDGNPFKVTRKTTESFTLEDARLSINIAIQKNTLKEFMCGNGKLARDTGFLARFLLSNPASTQGTRMFKAPQKDWPALASFNTKVGELLDLIDADRPRLMLKLSESAYRQWVEFHNEIETQLADNMDFTLIKDVASKAADNCARLAAVFHVFENGPYGEIDDDNIKRAAKIVEWHLYQTKKFLYGSITMTEESDSDILKKWLIKECRKKGASSIKYSNILQSGPSRLRNKDALMSAIDQLSAADIAKLTDSAGTMFIDVHPLILESHAASDNKY